MRIVKVKRRFFESRRKKLKLIEIGENRYLYKKSYKYKLKKFLKVIGMILWMPLYVPITFIYAVVGTITDSIIDYFIELFESCKEGMIQNYFKKIKEEFSDIFQCILDIVD